MTVLRIKVPEEKHDVTRTSICESLKDNGAYQGNDITISDEERSEGNLLIILGDATMGNDIVAELNMTLDSFQTIFPVKKRK